MSERRPDDGRCPELDEEALEFARLAVEDTLVGLRDSRISNLSVSIGGKVYPQHVYARMLASRLAEIRSDDARL